MNDRELLELAAKAAGIKPDLSTRNGGPSDNTGFDVAGNMVTDWHNHEVWNPLVSDGDALRLADALELEIRRGLRSKCVYVGRPGETFDTLWEEAYCHHKSKSAATRRAIVRAAANAPREAHERSV